MLKKNIYLYLVVSLFSACSYLPEPINPSENLHIEESLNYISLGPANTSTNERGIIFYPGGLVDPHAYINTLAPLSSEHNYQVVIVKVAANLAITNINKANTIIKEFPASTRWALGGHSLGAAVACLALNNHPNTYEALFLLDGYASVDLSGWDGAVLSLYSSGITYVAENAANLPAGIDVALLSDMPTTSTQSQSIYHEIVGANHAQFGSYGAQNGDVSASISPSAQQNETRDFILAFFAANNF